MDPVVFRLPDIGEGLVEGEVVAWLVAEGDAVVRDQPLVEVLTDKATVELPSPVAGRVRRLMAPPGTMVAVGEPLVELDPDQGEGEGEGAEAGTGPRPKAAPATRRLALELGVDLAPLTGTGPGGRITPEDVQAAAAVSATPERSAGEHPGAGVHPLRGIRRATAEAMARSWASVPHVHVTETADGSRLVELLDRLRSVRSGGPPVTPLTLFVAAAARALRRHPAVNASIDTEAGTITVHDGAHVGVAVATEEGLVVPVVRHADTLDLPALAAELDRLVGAARTGSLRPGDLRGGTFTVTNYGRLGGEWATPLIRPPEAAILGVGSIRPRPFVVGSGAGATIEARPTIPLVVGADHRLVDGDLVVAFLAEIARLLAEPLELVLRPGDG